MFDLGKKVVSEHYADEDRVYDGVQDAELYSAP